jgi:Zn-dependent peptidase ImmA (M78 family)
MSAQFARRRAEQLLADLKVSAIPIDVRLVAKALDMKIVEAPIGPGVSGMLVTNDTAALVCVNKKDGKARQRFSIAHEIAHHYLKHQFEPGEHVHVDRGNFISWRGPRAAEGVDVKEIEANQFAAALLMPSKAVRAAVKTTCSNGPVLDWHVAALARRFDVSEQAMTIRLTHLKLL